MITPVMHKRIDFHMDKVKSPRLSKDTKDQALNLTIDKFIVTFTDTFQIDQYSRDCLRPLVKADYPVTVAGNVITYPADYRQMLGLTLTIDGVVKYWTRDMLFNEKGPNLENSFTVPTPEYPSAIESAAGLKVLCGSGVVSVALMDYVIQQTDVLYSSTTISAGPAVLTVGSIYYVETAPVFHNSVQYAVGDSFTAVGTALSGAGTVALIRNCQLGTSCHEEICKVAAAVISGTLGDMERFQVKAVEGKR